jgi:hypothetical protein
MKSVIGILLVIGGMLSLGLWVYMWFVIGRYIGDLYE